MTRRVPPDEVCDFEVCEQTCDETTDLSGGKSFYYEYEATNAYGSYAAASTCDCDHHTAHEPDCTCEDCYQRAYDRWYDLEEARMKEERAGIV